MDTEEGATREREVANTTKALKALAKQFDIPVVILSQLNRENEKRDDKRPNLSDLKDSGAIEADADVVIFVHRPEYYKIFFENNKSTRGRAELIIAKHRNGEVGSVWLNFDMPTADFRDYDDV
jgi:replicative DNA helicase